MNVPLSLHLKKKEKQKIQNIKNRLRPTNYHPFLPLHITNLLLIRLCGGLLDMAKKKIEMGMGME